MATKPGKKNRQTRRKSVRGKQGIGARAGHALRQGASVFGHGLGMIGKGLSPVTRPAGRVLSRPRTWIASGLVLSSVLFAGFLVLTGYMFFLTRGIVPPADADLWSLNRPPAVTFLDQEGERIGTRGGLYGEMIPAEELPDYVVDAFLSTEDRRFYSHNGFDPKGFARAVFTNIRTRTLSEGASTVTQQLARNLFLTSDKTIQRKLQELHLAFWLESHLSKEEILTLYLNRIYLGAGTYGIEAASRHYFSKPASELTLSEAALLAGLPKAPSTLAPTTNFAGAAARSREVIDNLVETGKISEAEAELAKETPPELVVSDIDGDYGYFFDFAMREADRLLEGLEQDVVITTTIDPSLQRAGRRVMREAMSDEVKALGAEQAALIAYRNDGAIITMIGGLSYEDSQFNRATQAVRQPGSTFKPFVYLAALRAGMSPRTLFIDQPITIDGWQPQNYSGTFSGPMRMTEALANSVNTIAVQTMETVGRDKVIATAHDMGIEHELQPVPSIALGAGSVSLNEITAAYLPFARGGVTASPYAITRIENGRGEVIWERQPGQERTLFDSDTSEQMNYLLHQVMVNGTGSRASLGARQAAGKTGTTDDWRDAWFVGYTGQITAGVWVGNDDNRPMQKVTGGAVPASIWKSYMIAAHDGLPRLALPGADQLKYDSSDMRLARFYGNLQADLSSLAYGTGTDYAGWDGFPEDGAANDNRSGGNQVVGRAYDEAPPPPEREEDRPRRRRSWWPF